MGYRTADLQLIDLCAVILNWAKQKNGSHDGRVAAQVQHFPSSSQIAAWGRSYKTFFFCKSCEIFQRPCQVGNPIRTVKSSDFELGWETSVELLVLLAWVRILRGGWVMSIRAPTSRCEGVRLSQSTSKGCNQRKWGTKIKSDVVIRAHILLDIFSLMT